MKHLLLACGLVISSFGAAQAADPLVYSPAPAGNAFYGGQSMFVADMSFAGGTFGNNLGVTGTARAGLDFPSFSAMFEVTGTSATYFGGFGHLYKNFGHVVVGAFAGAGGGSGSGLLVAGIEGAVHPHPNMTIGGEVAMNVQPQGSTYASAAAHVEYYFTPGFMLRGDYAYVDSPTGKVNFVSGTVAYQLASMPHLVIHGTGGVRNRPGQSQAYAMFGATLLLDQPTLPLQEHNRRLPFHHDLAPFGF